MSDPQDPDLQVVCVGFLGYPPEEDQWMYGGVIPPLYHPPLYRLRATLVPPMYRPCTARHRPRTTFVPLLPLHHLYGPRTTLAPVYHPSTTHRGLCSLDAAVRMSSDAPRRSS